MLGEIVRTFLTGCIGAGTVKTIAPVQETHSPVAPKSSPIETGRRAVPQEQPTNHVEYTVDLRSSDARRNWLWRPSVSVCVLWHAEIS